MARLMLLAAVALSGAERMPRIAIGGIMHESNSFNPEKTVLTDFRISRGKAIEAEFAASSHELSGYFEGARQFGFEAWPVFFAQATPGGPVADQALAALTEELVRSLKAVSPLDGVLLALHGAMVAESYPHGDAEVVRRLRQALGNRVPIVVTHDFHANISPEVVELSTALVNYKTNPHVDQRERGRKAAALMSAIVQGKVRPVQVLLKPGMLYNIRFQNTSAEPLAPVVEESRELEKQPKILAASVAGGYQYADTPAMGASVVVVTDNDPELARRTARRLAEMLWATRAKLVLNLPGPAEAVQMAMSAAKFPVVLVDMGDNIGGGSAGDSTFLLGELLRQNARGWFMAIADAEAVRAAMRAGVGQPFDMPVGGKRDAYHGPPVRIQGRVKSLHDGKYVETEVRHGGGRYHDQGFTAVIEVNGSTRDEPNLAMLTTRRQPPFSLHQLISCGVYPERQKILVVKAAIAFRAAYEPVAARIIEVDTGGVTAVNPARFTYKRATRPLFGLDPPSPK